MLHSINTNENGENCGNAKQPSRLISLTTTIACLLLLVLGCYCSCDEQQEEPTVIDHEQHATLVAKGYNFTPQQTSNIIDNLMHEAHVDSAEMECKTCHQEENAFLSHNDALTLCHECHQDQRVVLPIWNDHCISCHQFTKFTEQYSDSTGALRELCQDCHGEGSMFFRAFTPGSPHDITCDNCHQPHRSALVVATGLCEECHEEITDVTSTDNKVHGSCIVCHTPHTALPKDNHELCNECHTASSGILVHNVPEHPNDCLACHSPHFTETEITSGACLVCHDDTYYGGTSNLPYAHRDCQSCHYGNSFHYMGDDQCASCHESEGEVVASAILPPEHRECATCHPPHSWYTKFEHNCDRCHDVAAVVEHRLSFHQADCAVCHDPHHTDLMAKSGHCDGCHGEGTYPDFSADLSDMHLQCTNCHSQVAVDSRDFSFIGSKDSCLICHTQADADTGLDWDDAPDGHRLCQACHDAHTFDTSLTNMRCDLCHRDVFESFPPPAHSDCFNCHVVGHAAEYAGQAASCDKCHAEERNQATIDLKADCSICHASHDFIADEKTCLNCHAELAATITTEMHSKCSLCHGDHTWQPSAEVCSNCHSEPPELHQVHGDAGCQNCHTSHSMATELSTCTICHTDIPRECSSSNCLNCHAFADSK